MAAQDELSRVARVNQISSSARQQAYMFLLPDEYKDSYDASVFTGHVAGYNFPKGGGVIFVVEIKCGGCTLRVARTYEQFAELHNQLKQILKKAGHEDKLPPLPPTSFFKSKSTAFLDKRLAGLQNWFAKVFSITDPDVPTLNEVREFAQLDAQLVKQDE